MIPRLAYITDGERGTAGRPLARVVAAAARGGADAVILREFELSDERLGELLESLEPLRPGLRLLVSRRLDVAAAYRLDGVHLARDAVPVAEARAWLGEEALIGYSAHSGEEAWRAGRDGASYVTLSPIYPTESKPGAPGRGVGWLAEAAEQAGVPVLALGGVTPERAGACLRAGASGVAAVAAIGAAPDVEAATRAFMRALVEKPQ